MDMLDLTRDPPKCNTPKLQKACTLLHPNDQRNVCGVELTELSIKRKRLTNQMLAISTSRVV